jgi:hypothetical protein
MRFYWLAVGVLCVWRVTHLLFGEDGPWGAVAKLRQFAGNGFWGELLDCFYCLSLWISAPLAYLLGESRLEQILLWPALSAGAILLERSTSSRFHAPPAHYFEDEENNHALLQRQKNAVPSAQSTTAPHPPPQPQHADRGHL